MTTVDATGKETTRERILRVATEMFAERGYHGTSVADLGIAAGIKRGALYYHIGSKEELLFDMAQRHVEEALARGTAVVEQNLHPIDKLRALAREHVAAVAARRAEVTVVMREMHTLTGERAEQLKALRDQHQALFRRVLGEGVERGVFRSHDSVTVLGIMGLYNWTHVWFDPVNGPLTADEVADRLTDTVIYGQLLTTGTERVPAIG